MYISSLKLVIFIFFYWLITFHNVIYLCVCCWTPVRGVCPNYEMVEFQPQTVTPPEPRLCR